MKRMFVRMAIAAAALGMFAAVPASAQEVTVCVEAHVEVQGQILVDETQSQTLPPA